jgi:hypothetical protein
MKCPADFSEGARNRLLSIHVEWGVVVSGASHRGRIVGGALGRQEQDEGERATAELDDLRRDQSGPHKTSSSCGVSWRSMVPVSGYGVAQMLNNRPSLPPFFRITRAI